VEDGGVGGGGGGGGGGEAVLARNHRFFFSPVEKRGALAREPRGEDHASRPRLTIARQLVDGGVGLLGGELRVKHAAEPLDGLGHILFSAPKVKSRRVLRA